MSTVLTLLPDYHIKTMFSLGHTITIFYTSSYCLLFVNSLITYFTVHYVQMLLQQRFEYWYYILQPINQLIFASSLAIVPMLAYPARVMDNSSTRRLKRAEAPCGTRPCGETPSQRNVLFPSRTRYKTVPIYKFPYYKHPIPLSPHSLHLFPITLPLRGLPGYNPQTNFEFLIIIIIIIIKTIAINVTYSQENSRARNIQSMSSW